jgi:hypothetical protein
LSASFESVTFKARKYLTDKTTLGDTISFVTGNYFYSLYVMKQRKVMKKDMKH